MLFSADALVTMDPLSRRRGPRLMPPALNDAPEEARSSLTRLEPLKAELLLPGHGEPWTGIPTDAVALARDTDGTPPEGAPR